MAADLTWTNTQVLSTASRSNSFERQTAGSSNPSPRTPLNPQNDPGAEVPSNAPRTLTVRIQDTPGSPVDLRFVESKGAVKVTVRAEDNQLARAIASELPGFERGLESRGWSSELHAPNQFREAKHLEETPMATRQRAETEVPLPGADSAQNPQDSDRRHRARWDEEIEDRTVSAALRRLSILKEQF